MTHGFRVYAGLAGLLTACIALSGCIGSPKYGTDKTSAEQLMNDIGDVASIKGKPPEDNSKYKPRPGLVLPAQGQREALIEPQKSVASKDNPAWVESPEETRARLRAEAEANKDMSWYRSPLAKASSNGSKLSNDEQLAAYRAARAEQKGSYEGRRYLTDPPATYRQVSDPTVLTDVGEPEAKKEKRRKEEAKAAKQDSSWWNPFK